MNDNRQNPSASGFTRPELLAVVAASALLVPLITAATRPGPAKTAVCLDNLRTLAHGMALYSEENRGWLPGNSGVSGKDWVEGNPYFGGSDFTNTVILCDPTKSRLTPYLTGVPAVYRCPADRLTSPQTGNGHLQARSYSLNAAVGTDSTKPVPVAAYSIWLDGASGSKWRTYGRYADMVEPAPAQLFTFLDEHPHSINDCIFYVTMGTDQWIDWPANHHDSGDTFAFADGHTEYHRWHDQRTLVTGPLALNVPSHGNPDLVWIQQRTSARIPR